MTTPHSMRGTRPAGAYLDEATRTEPPAATQAAADLQAVREQWGDLLAAIEQRPAATWPPLDSRALGAEPDDTMPDTAEPGRLPLTLREHPAPLNLTALDAAVTVEELLFDMCDAIAELVQRSVRRHLVGRRTDTATLVRWAEDPTDRDDPARWHTATHSASVTTRTAAPGSRAHGLHWAAVWLEGRALGEMHDDLFRPLQPRHLDHLADTAATARRHVERALNRTGRTIALDRPCPWCAGTLVGRTAPGGEPSVTCTRGESCGAPVILDRGRRVWRGAELVGLYVAMEAAQRRGQPAA